MSSSSDFVQPDPTSSRTHYNNVLQKIQGDGVCPFCPTQLAQYHKNPILHTGNYWLLTTNMYAYKGTAHHFLIIHKEHIVHMRDLSAEAWAELHEIIQSVVKNQDIAGGTFMLRFGNPLSTGASVSHLHAHIIVSDAVAGREPILTRVG
jgi:diadenosine tetraphosphate (Ap4A) HIT family hydrolase